ncbi:glucosyl-3-phosphoglycerate synthase [Puniceicoccales bacterium CK1056]|uniref:Glucosyl-3-phosphoglycerate synthase n=1 Tax=Oceanipulchritudo coccoides TaxID=2706888 RepID=A0A6B2M447_9BACT|nr:glucosyl-3-phosphoglycerate synthase [Oceanipulchritudo coccoides]NDV62999.1 glucosyl-3-phosphoglycerate synthase [Oceanipulchritudo coccoides]
MSNIEKWLESNTFHHGEFWDLLELVKMKEKKDLKISLCIPTLNEEKTIGKEIVIFKSELMDRYPLIDEIAVIDSGSTDKTRETAAAFGADVYLSSEILPSEGFKRGKGENLWKAIYQLEGDIICYVDADIKNIHPRFATGLIAPLIQRDQMQYVKAFYDRPLAFSQGVRPSGGGRVTEILVRPLFSLFFPELTSLIQPLSGEYAVRREVLESIPFPIGYGVETSHIIDVYMKYGLDAFGQTDLDQRVHRNQSTLDLGKMAFGILQSFLNRMEAYDLVDKLPEMSNIFRQFQAEGNRYEQVLKEIIEEERPPMIEIAEYREKFGLKKPKK